MGTQMAKLLAAAGQRLRHRGHPNCPRADCPREQGHPLTRDCDALRERRE